MVAFAVIYSLVQALRMAIFSRMVPANLHEAVLLRAATSLILIWLSLGAVLLIVRLRGQSIRELGWRRRSPLTGWLVALVVAVLYAGFTAMGPAMRHAPVLTDWSLFRIGTALAIGISAGICEETIFRGFVMTQARDGGANIFVQVVLSAILFGLAHVGWGGLTGRFEVWTMVASMTATMILGALLAIADLVAKRSLMPVIAAHAVIDMVIEPWLLLFMIGGAHFY
jgi:membrane protease YdiL (CAAX protease family)